MSTAPWKEFEQAVAAFIAALDPTAAVSHNVNVPDRHTGQSRQRDVWIEARVCGLFPVKILVSCKRWSRKLSQQDVDAFYGEFLSSGAHKGVLYSYSGFSTPAIRKASKLDICCCTLYLNRPPDLPEILVFESFCFVPQIRVRLSELPDAKWGLNTYADLFQIGISTSDRQSTVLDRLTDLIWRAESQAVEDYKNTQSGPKGWIATFTLHDDDGQFRPIELMADGRWCAYRAKLEAHLVNGSYSFTEGAFHGSITAPSVDLRGPAPGPGWELLEEWPLTFDKATIGLVLYHGDVRDALRLSLGALELSSSVQLTK